MKDTTAIQLRLNVLERIRRISASWTGLVIWCGAATLLLYGSSLSLPFFLDDLIQFPWVDEKSLTQIWQTADGLVYFRPLAFTIWKSMYLILGYHSAFANHAFNLILHWGNGLLVAWLAARLWPGRTRNTPNQIDWRFLYLSATLFLFFPFSYQAVPWVGSMMHLLVTALLLASLAAYLRMRESGRRMWGVFSLLLAFLSPFAHETGVLIGPLIACIELTRASRSDSIWRALRRAVIWSLPALLWLPIWWFTPDKVLDSNLIGWVLNQGESLVHKSAYFIQGIAYPLSWLGGWLRNSQGVEGSLAALSLSATALGGAALIQWRSGATRRDLFPWLWCGLTIVPAIVVLQLIYIVNAPRLLMLPSVGAAWLWADAVLRIADWSFSKVAFRRLGKVVAAGFVVMLLIQNFIFIRERMQLHDIGGSFIHQAATATTSANAAGQPVIFVNLPAWIAPVESTYAVGQEGVKLFPGFAPDDRLVSVNTGRAAELQVVVDDTIRSETPYFFGLHGPNVDWPALAQSDAQVYVAHYSAYDVLLRQAGSFINATISDALPLARFDESITLLAANATLDDAGLTAYLIWQVQDPPEPHVTVFVHVFDEAGQLLAQADGDPISGSFPFFLWVAGTTIQDTRFVDVQGSNLTFRVGLYNRLSGERLAAVAANGEPWADQSVVVPVSEP